MSYVITGIGCVSSIGDTAREFGASVLAGTCGIRPLDKWVDAKSSHTFAAVVPAAKRPIAYPAHRWRSLDKVSKLCVQASAEAIHSAGLPVPVQDRTAVVVGCMGGGVETVEEAYERYFSGRTVPRLTLPRGMANAPASAVVEYSGANGPGFAVGGACSSSLQAVGVALALLEGDYAECVIVGGAEASMTFAHWQAWQRLQVMSRKPCKPFSVNRDGTTLGEGAGMMVVERREQAIARGAVPHARLMGCGMSSSGRHIMASDVDAASLAMERALERAELDASEVAYINAHGTGTIENDAVEAEAIARTFGRGRTNVKVSSTKAMHGHTLAAAGAIELIATIWAIRNGVLPPNINCDVPEVYSEFDLVTSAGEPMPGNVAMTNAFGFGGMNCSVVVADHNVS